MNVEGRINLFVKTTDKGQLFTGSLSKKDSEGKSQSARINVKFAGEKFPKEKLAKVFTDDKCYCLEVSKGFLSFTKTEEGRVYLEIVVLDAKVPETYEIKNKPAEDVDLLG